MKLEEIEATIAALKARKADLDAKPLRTPDGGWDGDLMAADAAIEQELKRLSDLRAKALAGVETESEPLAQPPRQAVAAWPMPKDFKSDPADKVDPMDNLDVVPDGAAYGEMTVKLFNYNLEVITEYIADCRKSLKNGERPVLYTQGQHLAVLAALAFVQTKMRILVAYGRDRRNEVEKKLLARIEALEARPELKYLGVWASETVYGAGTFITDGGSVWHAQRASVGEKPGAGDAWQLAVKKGRDAR